MKDNKGFTLIELAVVLAIIAVLAAILTPMVVNYLDQARVSRAIADANTIAQAVQLYRKDTGFYPVYASLANSKTGSTDYGTLSGPSSGTTPTVGNGVTGWGGNLTGTTVGDIQTVLNTNPTGMGANDKNPGKASYRGPYLTSLDTDPWGNKFIIANLTTVAGVTAGSHAFVLSAGPNGQIETNAAQTGTALSVGGDDITAQIN